MKADLPSMSAELAEIFDRAAGDGLRLVRRPGGQWTTPNAPKDRRGRPTWYTTTQNVTALERLGVLRPSRLGEWRADRVIHEDYLALAQRRSTEAAA